MAVLQAPALTVRDEHVWITAAGVFSLPLYRVVGVTASANATFSSPPLTLPALPLWANMAAGWHGAPPGDMPCDEACASYVAAELRDQATGDVVPGFEREKCLLMDIDGLRVPLLWQGVNTTHMVGRRVIVRFYLRRASVFAIGAG